jgi:hypothetical protein
MVRAAGHEHTITARVLRSWAAAAAGQAVASISLLQCHKLDLSAAGGISWPVPHTEAFTGQLGLELDNAGGK